MSDDALLTVPTSWVYSAAARGELPSLKVGVKYRRFERAAVEAWLERQRQGGVAK